MDVVERPKRQKRDSSGKMKAFEKLKQVKSGGGKNKYEIGTVENVYEEVTEEEYTKEVLKRQHDDWIVGDYGAEGYVEDGREIFDDDLDEESIQKDRKSKKRDHSGVPKNAEPPKGNIQKMLANMPAKKKRTVNLDNDKILGDLMNELDSVHGFTAPKMETKIAVEPIRSGWQTLSSSETKTIPSVHVDIPKLPSTEKEVKSGAGKNKYEVGTIENVYEEVTEEEYTKDDNLDDDKILGDLMNEFDSVHASTVPKIEKKITEEQIYSGWQTSSSSETKTVPQVNVDTSKLPLTEKEDGTKVLKFFYWDAYEDVINQSGKVYLFGKVCVEGTTYASCCVIVENIERRMYLLPRERKYDTLKKQSTDEKVSLLDVYNEFNHEIAEKYRITTYKSRKVNKNYAFDIPNVPDSSDYLEIRYGAEFRTLPSDLSGETFSHVFGSNTSFLEIFLIERKIKGPNWLEIVAPVPSKGRSWCKYEIVCNEMNNISVVTDKPPPPPPLVLMAINIRITPLPKNENQVTMISCLVNNNYCTDKEAPKTPFEHHLCVYTRPDGASWPYNAKQVLDQQENQQRKNNFHRVDNEYNLLSYFLTKFHKFDPDLIVGHDIYGFDVGILIRRLENRKIMHWSRIGRLHLASVPNYGKNGFIERNVMCGRLLCDIQVSAKELIKARSYDLDSLCEQVLGKQKGTVISFSSEEIKKMYENSDDILRLINLTMTDTSLILLIMYKLNVIPLSLQITNIAGNIMSRTLMGGRAERNEYLLLHAFYEKNYIVPDKTFSRKGKVGQTEIAGVEEAKVGKGKRKPQYEGGLVLEPKKGFYDKLILLMDFNSLYPSIIQEYNICFTTVAVRGMNIEEDDLMTLMSHIPQSTQPGILPTEIRKLVQSRRDVKKLMAKEISPDLKHQYDIRQLALKLTANSMYGCLGFPNSRFYAKPLAAMVTAKGREILVNTRDLVQRLNFDVIYGDTDSLMINTNAIDYDEIFKIGHKIKHEVNKLYKQIELDIDGVFKFMLLLKKKKYAAVTLTKVGEKLVTKQEIKGLDIVRRDWSKLSADAGRYVLDQLLCDQNLEDKLANIHANLARIKQNLEENKFPISDLGITKQLTKNPEEYPDKKSLPHVQVALRMNQTRTKKFKQGDTIFYVVCEDGTTNAATQRAYHIEELSKNSNLKIDIKYYLSQQVHPVVTRLCEPIEDIDAVQIAESLGLDTSTYIRRIDTVSEENDEITVDDADKYKNCEKFQFRCPDCSTLNIVESPTVKNENNETAPALEQCANTNCKYELFVDVSFIQNLLTMEIRSFIHKYYAGWMVCEEPTCAYRTRVMTRFNKNFDPLCTNCKEYNNILIREYDESQLYNQLCFYQHLFDITSILNKHKLKIPSESDLYKAYVTLKGTVDEILNCNAYNIIDLGKICEQMFMKN